MSERLNNKYLTLFQIHILHHYWLDEDAILFDQISDQTKKDNRLLTYDVRTFLTLTPTQETAKTLQALSCIYKSTALGLVVVAPSGTVIPKETVFEWIITVNNSDFFIYTALTLRSQKIHNLYHPLENKLYRYKENVPVLSNLTGVTRGTVANKSLFLSQEFPALATDEQIEALVLISGKVKQLINNQPNAATKLIGTSKDLPVFIHQGDIPVITPPVGLDGVPKRGILLTDAIPDTVFALIRLNAVKAGNGGDIFSFVDNAGLAKVTPPVFQIRFKNRSTIWQYFNKSDGVFKSEEANLLPLTYFGNAGTKQKPSAGLPKVIKDGVKVRLVSEIFE